MMFYMQVLQDFFHQQYHMLLCWGLCQKLCFFYTNPDVQMGCIYIRYMLVVCSLVFLFERRGKITLIADGP